MKRIAWPRFLDPPPELDELTAVIEELAHKLSN